MATTFRYLNFEYEVIDSQKNEVALIDASHATGTITIPSEVECNGRKFKVTKISGKRVEYWYQPDDRRCKKECRNEFRGAFQGKDYNSYSGRWTDSSSIIEVIIPNSVTSIGNHAFCGCKSLTAITIPNSVTSIGWGAFVGCKALTSITIPNSVTSIWYDAFHSCESLTSITIPNSVTSIGNHTFCDCKSLTSITIPNSVTSIGSNAFCGCKSLTSITIPNSVTSIENHAFGACEALTSITIPNSVTSIGRGAFSGCKSLTSITIPNSVTSIGEYAFYDCKALTSITIPDSVTSIGEWAFSWCYELTSITIPNSVTSIGEYAFSSCDYLTSVTIENEKGKVKIKDYAFPYSAKINYVGKPKEQPAKPIENPYHQAIREAEEAAAKAAEKIIVNVETTPEPSQPVSPTTTQTRNRDKVDYVFNGKMVNHGVWTLEIADDKSVKIYKNGDPCKKTSPALRELAAEIGFTYDPKWNTRQLGGKLFAQLIKLT